MAGADAAGCVLCALVDRLRATDEVVRPAPGWSVNAFQGGGTRPRLVLQPVRHVERWGRLTVEEQGAMGRGLARCAAALERQPGVARVHVLSYNETPPGHLHVHLVPRFATEPPGPDLPADAAPPKGFDLQRVMDETRASGEEPIASSPLVRRTRAALSFWNSRVSVYPLVRAMTRRGVVADAGEAYVLGWVLLLVGLTALQLVLVAPDGPLAVAGGVVAGYRMLDMAAFVLTILTTTFQSDLQSTARSLLLFLLNLVELTAIGFLLLTALGVPPTDAVPRAVAITSSLGGADPAQPPAEFAALVAVNVVALLVVTLGVAMLVGKIGDSFRDLATSRSPDDGA